MDAQISIRSSAKLILLAIAALLGASLACNMPQPIAQATAVPSPFFVWSTNTPTAIQEPTRTPRVVMVSPTPQPTLDQTPTPPPDAVNTSPFLYYAQAGDTIPALAVRFSVLPGEIQSPRDIPERGMINPGQLLIIPRRLYNTTQSQSLIPDSEVVYSPSGLTLDIRAFVAEAGGDLATYREYLGSTGWTSGADIVARVALENSINPRVLLSLLEYHTGMVYGQLSTDPDYPLGHYNERDKGMFQQLVWLVNHLSTGYYGWREGRLTTIVLKDNTVARLAPDINTGTAAVHYFFSRMYNNIEWAQAADKDTGWVAVHERMFGNPWLRAVDFEPLFPPNLTQPELILPFTKGQIWAFTGGPHGAWEREGSYAALDFAPGSVESGCVPSDKWVVASAPGLVVRSGNGIVVLDMDGDGFEQTGWAIVYLHVSSTQRAPVGTWVTTGDQLGHPSCEGGYSTGTHLHMARKYNGEWIAADGPLPFNLSGWVAHAGSKPYEGYLVKGDQTIQASVFGVYDSRIFRPKDEP